MDKRYLSNARAYDFVFRPPTAVSDRLYFNDQLLAISHVSKSVKDVTDDHETRLVHLEGRLVSVALEPGSYQNATLTVDEAGRITGITAGAAADSPVPTPGGAGLVLTSYADGSYGWQSPPTATETVTVRETITAPTMSLRSLRDLDVTESDGVIEAELRATGVVAGTYSNPTFSVDEKGRILSVTNGEAGSDDGLRDGTYRYWRVMLPAATFVAPPPVVGAVAFLDTIDGPDLGGTETRVPGGITRTFAAEAGVIAITVTITTVATAPTRLVVQGSIDGVAWFSVWEAATRNWTAGETRTVRRKGTVTLTGDVTGTGEDEIVTTLSETGVAAGTYRNPELTVGADGRITEIANGTGGGGSFDPDTPIDYLTFKDQTTGDEIIATIESGAWVLTPAGIPLEDGSTLTTENGSDTIAAEA